MSSHASAGVPETSTILRWMFGSTRKFCPSDRLARCRPGGGGPGPPDLLAESGSFVRVVSDDQVLGSVDQGFRAAMWALQGGRIAIAAQAFCTLCMPGWFRLTAIGA